jgi:hypothetical protein
VTPTATGVTGLAGVLVAVGTVGSSAAPVPELVTGVMVTPVTAP